MIKWEPMFELEDTFYDYVPNTNVKVCYTIMYVDVTGVNDAEGLENIYNTFIQSNERWALHSSGIRLFHRVVNKLESEPVFTGVTAIGGVNIGGQDSSSGFIIKSSTTHLKLMGGYYTLLTPELEQKSRLGDICD